MTKPEEVLFGVEADANEVLDALKRRLILSEFTSVGDFYTLCGLASTWYDLNVGWINLDSAKVEPASVDDNTYHIVFPPTEPIV